MGISYSIIIIFGLPLTYAYAMLRQSVAGNSTFRGIVFCNFGIPKYGFLSVFTPYISPYGYPNNVPGGQKTVTQKKKVSFIFVLIPSTTACYFTIAGYGFFFGGAYGSLPDAAIWWCLRTGGGGVLTR